MDSIETPDVASSVIGSVTIFKSFAFDYLPGRGNMGWEWEMCGSQDHDKMFISIWTARKWTLGKSDKLLDGISFFFFFMECLLWKHCVCWAFSNMRGSPLRWNREEILKDHVRFIFILLGQGTEAQKGRSKLRFPPLEWSNSCCKLCYKLFITII